jgi:hypothetical protein
VSTILIILILLAVCSIRIDGFDSVAGRYDWFAGSAIVNGQRLGRSVGVVGGPAGNAGKGCTSLVDYALQALGTVLGLRKAARCFIGPG